MTMVWLTLAVALVHFALLEGLPNVVSSLQGDKAADAMFFTVHTIPTEPVHSSIPLPTGRPATARITPNKTAVPRPVGKPPPEPVPSTVLSRAQPPDATSPLPGQSDPVETLPIPDAAVPGAGNPPPDEGTPAPVQPAASVGAATNINQESERKLVFPPSVRMFFDVKGVVTYAYTGGSELLWLNHGNGYHARLQITKFGFNLRTWTSKGDLTGQGLAPLRFGDKGRSSEIASHFQRDKGIISFSANVPDVLLQEGAQDYLSSFFQLSAMLSGEPERYPPGTAIAFQVAGARGADPWIFHVDGLETLDLPDGPKAGVRLTREHDAKYDTKVELWLSPDLSYLPIRIRLSQANGDFAELLWRSSQKPD